jgi:hypothetical protein
MARGNDRNGRKKWKSQRGNSTKGVESDTSELVLYISGRTGPNWIAKFFKVALN